MCFSAQASFGASAALLTVGVISAGRSTNAPQKLLSCIPFVFGAQQFTEGVLWLSLSHTGLAYLRPMATYAFLVFAQVVWPTLVPLSVTLLEKHRVNKSISYGFLVIGIAVSSYLAYCLLFYKVQADISCYHIEYNLDYPVPFRYSGMLYVVATVIPPILSTIKRLRLLGIAIFVSYVVTRMFYEDYLISVWCYFAAVISIIVLSVITQLNRRAPVAAVADVK